MGGSADRSSGAVGGLAQGQSTGRNHAPTATCPLFFAGFGLPARLVPILASPLRSERTGSA